MLVKVKYGKIAIVVFLTILIWVWADLALDEVLPARPAVIEVEDSAGRELWVSFTLKPSVDIKVTLSGPHSAFVALDRRLRSEGRKLTFVFDAVAEKLTEPPGRPLRVLGFLQKDKELKRLGLKVKSCEPEVVDVNVVGLVKRPLPVECFDGDGLPLSSESIKPDKVEMFVPEHVRSARVRLSGSEVVKARLAAIDKMPYVVFAADQVRLASAPVKVKLPPEEDRLTNYFVAPSLAIALSPVLQGEYDVEINMNEVMSSRIAIRATLEAKEAYEAQPYPRMTLYILDDDLNEGAEEQHREVVYNFPPEYVRKGEIELQYPEQPLEVKFKLIQLTSAEAPPGGAD